MIDLNLNPPKKELRVFAALQVVFFAIIAVWVYRRFEAPAAAFTIAGVSLVAGVVGWLIPSALKPIYVVWMIAVYPIGWVISHIVIGMHDFYTGLDEGSLEVIADFPVDDVTAGENLASRFQQISPGVWDLKLSKPVASLAEGTLVVSVKDREGNTTRIERTFSVAR